MSEQKKEYKTELVGCFYPQNSKYGTFWRTLFDEDGGCFVLNPAKEGAKYEFTLTYDPTAKAEYDAYIASRDGGEAEAPKKAPPTKRGFPRGGN